MEEEHYYRSRNRTRAIFNYLVLFAILLVAFAVFYYLVIFQPQKNEKQLQQQLDLEKTNIQQKVTNQKKLSECIDEVNKRFSDPKFLATIKGVKVNSEDAKVILDLLNQQKNECYKKYPQ